MHRDQKVLSESNKVLEARKEYLQQKYRHHICVHFRTKKTCRDDSGPRKTMMVKILNDTALNQNKTKQKNLGTATIKQRGLAKVKTPQNNLDLLKE